MTFHELAAQKHRQAILRLHSCDLSLPDHDILQALAYMLTQRAMQACVIYRDIDDGPKLTEVCDFVNKQGLDVMTSFMSGVYATGGADECESIASGLKVNSTLCQDATAESQPAANFLCTLYRQIVIRSFACSL